MKNYIKRKQYVFLKSSPTQHIMLRHLFLVSCIALETSQLIRSGKSESNLMHFSEISEWSVKYFLFYFLRTCINCIHWDLNTFFSVVGLILIKIQLPRIATIRIFKGEKLIRFENKNKIRFQLSLKRGGRGGWCWSD